MTEQPNLLCQPLVDTPGLPQVARDILCELVSTAQACLGDDLSSIVLYGSAAEGRLRATSDINLLMVLTRFTPAGIDPLRETLRLAQTIADARVMFVLHSELTAASEAFAMKFADIIHRHRVLYGADPFQALDITREAKMRRLRQVLLNLVIRLRERYALTSLREEQLALVLADISGPLRVAAATLLDLQEHPAVSAKAALETLAPTLGVEGWQQALAQLSTVRETRKLSPGVAAATCFTVLAMAEAMRRMAERM